MLVSIILQEAAPSGWKMTFPVNLVYTPSSQPRTDLQVSLGCCREIPQADGLHHRHLYLTVLEAGKSKMRMQQTWGLENAHILPCRWPSFCVLTWQRIRSSTRCPCEEEKSEDFCRSILVSELPVKAQCSQALDGMMLRPHRGETERDQLQEWASVPPGEWASPGGRPRALDLCTLYLCCSRRSLHPWAGGI